jgi:hypothetical protein
MLITTQLPLDAPLFQGFFCFLRLTGRLNTHLFANLSSLYSGGNCNYPTSADKVFDGTSKLASSEGCEKSSVFISFSRSLALSAYSIGQRPD